MSHLRMKLLCISVTMAMGSVHAAELSVDAQHQPVLKSSLASKGKLNKTSTAGNSVYIVEFTAPPLATYNGGIKGYKATSNKMTGANKLNTKSKESKAYHKYLKKNQQKFVADLGAQSKVKFDYQYVFNGVALEMSAAEAKALESNPEVKRVYLEHIETPDTDSGPKWINADSIWGGTPNNVPHSQGEGIVVAVLDTGINHGNASFADVGGDGYNHTNPLGSGNYLPGSYCDTQDASFCNDKLIGAWSFVPLDSHYPVPEDSDGHGSHTASTVAGNVNPIASVEAPTTSLTRNVSGVAPHANIIAYDVCTAGCPGSALLAAINQVVVDAANLPDGIHALNYSISGGSSPYTDAVEIGFLNATAAGIYVAASAGNSGPGASTLGHQSPWVSTTGASTHNRSLVNTLLDMDSDQGPLADISSVGFTSGYGPASIVYAGDHPTANGSQNDSNPAQCLDPFPAGHFNGEIVVCDRGAIARTAKGQNVLAGGAGGFVLANLASNGESVSGDAHYLPALHLGVTAADTLKAWLASNTNTVASISGYEVVLDDSLGDVMAGFSSRGPNTALDIIKPDLTAPGVDILAALSTSDLSQPDVYGFLSGTSMSSPHNAGAGAIVSAAQPAWSPYAVRSAMMMTSVNSSVLKEDGVTPADPFDMGAGRIDLARAIEVDLVLDETPLNFWNANPETGGDPKTLNIASMQDGKCVGSCEWTRTFTNTAKHTVHVDLSTSGGDASYSVSPSRLKIKGGKTGSFTVSVDSSLASGWDFGQVDIARRGDGPDMHMPIAINAVTSTDAAVFTKTVDKADASNGDTLTYGINITNGQLGGNIDLSDSLPAGVTAIAGSETATIVDGTSISPFSLNGNSASWTGTLDIGSIAVTPSASPFGLFPLANLGISPLGCPSDCDDGAFSFNVPAFQYNGQMYTQMTMSVNGTLEVGSASGNAVSASINKLPNATPPNNLLAPFWSDLNMNDGGNMYVGVLNAGPNQFTVYEWNSLPLYGSSNAEQYTFQVWVLNGSAGGIWFTYGGLGDLSYASVGAENEDGSTGSSYYFSGDGSGIAPGADLAVSSVQGGSAHFTFQAEVTGCSAGEGIVNQADVYADDNAHEKAIAVTRCN
ncbi:S8 family serine peptidase [Shewanella nanhaiensis]|uniref:S8 family serine peptidase n=1 Tax=Shewanella nanhaiensis TaxID=2864872 RepID=A0ABS7E3Z4_9GAMM|nr:S8 family serine peptidase [Shewanella nanhaiensis]MBW8184350.1 S8 family serine peptidase [Shewanella nanhaiensis]